MLAKTYDQIKIGDVEEIKNIISDDDVELFSNVTGDKNPFHMDEEYAAKTVFRKRIVHGMLLAGYISNVIGNKLPGHGTIYISQSLKFLLPVYLNDTIITKVEVVSKGEKKRITLHTYCINQDEKIVLDGEAVVSTPRK